ncbi:septin-10 [Gorgonomyces haynaldii]|nr:septin-10 [Gorgonomyces haynaldii]
MPLEYALQHRGTNPDPGPWKLPRSIGVRPLEALGIGDLPEQRIRRSRGRRYGFNIMVCGESGLGKTTFLNTLFNTDLTEHWEPQNLNQRKTTEISPAQFELVEEGVTLYLTVVDTPGFGDQLNRENNFEPVIQYIDKQYETYLEAERSQQPRRNIVDTRIHALLYFLPPTGKDKLNDLDLEFLRRLSSKVNVVPVIGRADSLTPAEIVNYKKGILTDLAKYDIRVYPTFHADDREFIAEAEQHVPFALIGSDQMINVNGKMVRGRSYRWGTVQVENPQHCDFVFLRDMLINHNMQDLIETTHTIHYSTYRAQKIRGNGRPESFLACDDFYESRIENAKRSLADEMQRKEDEMRQRFVSKVREKELELREREETLNNTRQRMMEELETLRKQVESEEGQLNELISNKNTKSPW